MQSHQLKIASLPQKPDDFRHPAFQLAESEGFEPPDPLRSTVFKTAAFDHSANSPICFPSERECKGTNNFVTCKFIYLLLQKIYTGKEEGRLLHMSRSCLRN